MKKVIILILVAFSIGNAGNEYLCDKYANGI